MLQHNAINFIHLCESEHYHHEFSIKPNFNYSGHNKFFVKKKLNYVRYQTEVLHK